MRYVSLFWILVATVGLIAGNPAVAEDEHSIAYASVVGDPGPDCLGSAPVELTVLYVQDTAAWLAGDDVVPRTAHCLMPPAGAASLALRVEDLAAPTVVFSVTQLAADGSWSGQPLVCGSGVVDLASGVHTIRVMLRTQSGLDLPCPSALPPTAGEVYYSWS